MGWVGGGFCSVLHLGRRNMSAVCPSLPPFFAVWTELGTILGGPAICASCSVPGGSTAAQRVESRPINGRTGRNGNSIEESAGEYLGQD